VRIVPFNNEMYLQLKPEMNREKLFPVNEVLKKDEIIITFNSKIEAKRGG